MFKKAFALHFGHVWFMGFSKGMNRKNVVIKDHDMLNPT
jgi:hypothetical protein